MSASEEDEEGPEGDSTRSLSPFVGHEEIEISSTEHGASADPKESSETTTPADDGVEAASLFDTQQDTDEKQEKEKYARNFPRRLMEILNRDDTQDGIRWHEPDGLSFVIVNPKIFSSEILPRFFKRAKFSSFTRKLNRYGFKRVSNGNTASGGGAFFHPLFQRNNPDLCLQITCKKPGSPAQGDEMPPMIMMPPSSPTTGRKRKLEADESLEPSPFPPGGNLGSMLMHSLPGQPDIGGLPLYSQANMGAGMNNMMPPGLQGNWMLQQQLLMQQQQQQQQQQLLHQNMLQQRTFPQLGHVPHTGTSDLLNQMNVGAMGGGSLADVQQSLHRREQLLADLEMQQQQLAALQQQLQQQQQMQQPERALGDGTSDNSAGDLDSEDRLR